MSQEDLKEHQQAHETAVELYRKELRTSFMTKVQAEHAVAALNELLLVARELGKREAELAE